MFKAKITTYCEIYNIQRSKMYGNKSSRREKWMYTGLIFLYYM